MFRLYIISFILALIWELEVCITHKRKYQPYDVFISLIPILNSLMAFCLVISILGYGVSCINKGLKKLLY